MTTLQDAKMSSLKDKIEAQAKQAETIAEKVVKAVKKTVKRKKKDE